MALDALIKALIYEFAAAWPGFSPARLRAYRRMTLVITRADGSKQSVKVKSRIDTPIEVDYYRHGGILHYVLRNLVAA